MSGQGQGGYGGLQGGYQGYGQQQPMNSPQQGMQGYGNIYRTQQQYAPDNPMATAAQGWQNYASPQQWNPYAGIMGAMRQWQSQRARPYSEGNSNFASPGGQETIMRAPVDPVPGWSQESGGGM